MRSGCSGAAAPCPSDAAVVYTASAAYGLSYDALRCPHSRRLPSSCPHSCRRIPRRTCVPAIRGALRLAHQPLPSRVLRCVRFVVQHAPLSVFTAAAVIDFSSVLPETSSAVRSSCSGCRCALPTSRSRREFCFACVRFVVRRALLSAFAAAALVSSSPCRRRLRQPCVPAVWGAAAPCPPAAPVVCSALRACGLSCGVLWYPHSRHLPSSCPLRAAGDLAGRAFRLFGVPLGLVRRPLPLRVPLCVRCAPLPALSAPPETSPAVCSSCLGCVAAHCPPDTSVMCSALRACGSSYDALCCPHSRQLLSSSPHPCRWIPLRSCAPAVRVPLRFVRRPIPSRVLLCVRMVRCAARSVTCIRGSCPHILRAAGFLASRAFRLFGVLQHLVRRPIPSRVPLCVRAVRRAARSVTRVHGDCRLFRTAGFLASRASASGRSLFVQHEQVFVGVNASVLEVAAAAEGGVRQFDGFEGSVAREHGFHGGKCNKAFGII